MIKITRIGRKLAKDEANDELNVEKSTFGVD